jgi:hypothetical protein
VTDPTPTEQEAIVLRWRHLHPEAAPDALPTKQQSDQILADIRARASAIEGEAMKMLNQKMRIVSSNGANSKQSAVSFLILIAALVIAALVYGLVARLNQ